MPAVVLHVGLPKSGTTAIQGRLVRNAATLRQQGFLVPLLEPELGRGSFAFRAALDLTGKRMGRPDSYADGYWDRLVGQVASHAGPVVVSHEAFVRCRPDAVARAVRELGEHHELHVVVTARDVARSVVSAWLEGLKHGTTRGLAEHVELARAGRLPVFRSLELPRVVAPWLEALPAGRVHLVTVPPPWADRSLLWERFCSAGGMPAAAAPRPGGRHNPGFGVPEAQLMLALNRRLESAVRRGGPLHRTVSRQLAPRLAARTSDAVTLDRESSEWAAAQAEAWRAWVEERDIVVHGDLADLRTEPPGAEAWVDPTAPHAGVAEAAVDLITLLME